MTPEEKLAEKAGQIKAIRKWPARLKKIRNRKKDPMKESEFCRKYGLPIPGFNRMKNLKGIACAENFKKVEEALKAEGV